MCHSRCGGPATTSTSGRCAVPDSVAPGSAAEPSRPERARPAEPSRPERARPAEPSRPELARPAEPSGPELARAALEAALRKRTARPPGPRREGEVPRKRGYSGPGPDPRDPAKFGDVL